MDLVNPSLVIKTLNQILNIVNLMVVLFSELLKVHKLLVVLVSLLLDSIDFTFNDRSPNVSVILRDCLFLLK